MLVPSDSPLAGKTIEDAGLRHLPGAYLVDIDRGGESIPAVAPDRTLKAGDRLIFAGIVESIRDLQNLRGLLPATNQAFKLDSPRHRRQLFEAVVSNTCPLAGKTIREGRFRQHYNAAVLAVARNGERIHSKIGDIELRIGDTLLIEAHQSFATQQRDSRDFFLVSPVNESRPRSHERFSVALAILAAMVIVAAAGWLDILMCAIIASSLMVVSRCCTISELRASIDWSVLIVIGASLGLGRAVEISGAARWMAEMVSMIGPDHPWLVLAVLYLATSLLNEFLANSAAVALVFPIAMESAARMDVNFLPFVIAIMMAGSNSFATPIGYQTNLMVYGPGGYRFSDYTKIGNLVTGAVALLVIPLVFPF
jgi:di/tricarboxylate transporter